MNQMNVNSVTKYITSASAYGAFRGVVRASNLKHHDGKTDALPTQKVCAVALSTLFAPTFLPIFLYNDTNRFYLTYTNGDFKKFGYEPVDRGVLHVLFE